ncbi:hypothetical protein M501DRAFT_211863 [Patellaria atrata CBS 101060]|uniref:Uncharacterized protein n=1 Tax=Patellaria atrata CBS 101060 TaxID=1346257 RepID=A0A9P4S870_9PEZI|nr:hypothetical protein M501DRAFT_211863 [Patellaria atrata CBS 101060]
MRFYLLATLALVGTAVAQGYYDCREIGDPCWKSCCFLSSYNPHTGYRRSEMCDFGEVYLKCVKQCPKDDSDFRDLVESDCGLDTPKIAARRFDNDADRIYVDRPRDSLTKKLAIGLGVPLGLVLLTTFYLLYRLLRSPPKYVPPPMDPPPVAPAPGTAPVVPV